MFIIFVIVFQVLIFAGLIFILKRTLTSNMASATSHLDSLNQEYTKKEEELNRRIEETKNRSQELLDSSRQEAEKLKTEIIKGAENEKERLVKAARTQSEEMIKQADKSRQALISEMEQKISEEAINKACDLTQIVLPEDVKQSVHTRWVEDLVKGGFSNLERLRIPAGIDEVKIASAFPLAEDQRKALMRKLKDMLNKDMKLKEETDPKLVAGIVISLGSIVLDGSLRNKVREAARKEKA